MAKRGHNSSLVRGTKWGPSEVLKIILYHGGGYIHIQNSSNCVLKICVFIYNLYLKKEKENKEYTCGSVRVCACVCGL